MGLIGSKGISFFRSLGLPVRAQLSGLGDNPTMEDLIGVVNGMFGSYKDEEVDAVYIAYNKFVNTMAQKPVYQQLIPLPALETDNLEQKTKHLGLPLRARAKSLIRQFAYSLFGITSVSICGR